MEKPMSYQIDEKDATAADKVYLYLFDDFGSLDESFVEHSLARLPDFRREQCLRYRRAEDRIRCIAAYLLLEKGLREQYGITQPVSFVCNKYGKPYLRECPEIYCSISHCESGVACAVSRLEIGADIQDARPFSRKLAERVCTDDELLRLEAAENPERLFCEFWTKKEGYAKAKGQGVTEVLKKVLPECGFYVENAPDYCLAVFHGTENAVVEVIKVRGF
jgi:4'-phosphopantetheinyl transferase